MTCLEHLALAFKSLHARRTVNDIVFLCKIFKGFVSSTCLLSSFSLHVPMRTTRNATSMLFHVPTLCLLSSFSLHVPMRTTRNATSMLFHVPSTVSPMTCLCGVLVQQTTFWERSHISTSCVIQLEKLRNMSPSLQCP